MPLNSYEDIVTLTGKVINGLLKRGELSKITRQDAHAIFIGTGYLTTAMREARGGKMKMSVYLQDVHNHRINLENIPPELMDRFCQGNEEVKMEVLQLVAKQGNVIDAEVRPTIKKPPQPRMDANLISDISGLDKEQIKDVLKGEIVDVHLDNNTHPVHEWTATLGGGKRLCTKCGIQKEILQAEDMTSACSQQDGLY